MRAVVGTDRYDSAIIAQQPKALGHTAVGQDVKAAKGEQVQQVIYVEVKAVTKKNVAELT
jgi:ribose transport system substrate-binding protein